MKLSRPVGNSGGSQDSYGAALGGIKLITYRKGGGSSCELVEVSRGQLRGQWERGSRS